MKGTRAAVRYAKALTQQAIEKNLLDAIVTDMKSIHNAIEESKELKLMLNSPLIKKEKKRMALQSIFQGKVNELTLQFINMVTLQGRENLLKVISEELIAQYNELKNIARVMVTTASPLSEAIKTELLSNLKAKYQFSEIELEEKVDADLIGGMILRIGDRQLDASVRRKLNDIKHELVNG